MAEIFFPLHKHQKNTALIKDCIEACLFPIILHFAGSWYESDMWLVDDLFVDDTVLRMNHDFQKYRKQLLTGAPAGMVKPKRRKGLSGGWL